MIQWGVVWAAKKSAAFSSHLFRPHTRYSEAEVATTHFGPEGHYILCRGRQAPVTCRTNAGAPEGRHMDDTPLHAPRWGSLGIRWKISGASRHRLGL
jgi:hypothetical protein